MKKTTISIITLMISIVSFAQDIATVRLQGVGATVTATGVVTNGDELGPIRYIEDVTAGLAIYDLSTNNYLANVVRGDSITITGTLVDYNGLLEMNPTSSAIIHSSNSIITPQIVTPLQIGEATESELIQIDNVIFNNGGALFIVGTHDFDSNGETGKIYIKAGSPLENSMIPMGAVTLIGISSQYTFSVPANDGYQILPRDSNDIIQSGNIVFTSAVNQTNITTTSFDLNWSTSISSSTNCNYGTTTSLLNSINNGGSSQNHTISLTGLSPATFYYVECYSVNGADTAFSSTGIYSTASLSSGIIRPYFNHSVDNSFSNGVDAQDIASGFADTIAAYIALAQNTLDICVYNASSTIIANAINAAHNNGVAVRYIADDDVANIMLSSLDSAIPVVIRDPAPAGIMHNKFMIIDANSTNNSWVLGGSTNWTNPSNLLNDYNNLIFVQDEAVAKAYTLEFEEMWGGVFGTNKLDNTPHKFISNGRLIEVYFSPSDQTTSHIIKTIQNVNNTLEFGLLAFTRDDIGQAVIDKDLEFGVTVRGIIEQENITGSEFSNLIAANVDVRSHTGVPNQLHHKYAIIDANTAASDPTVLTGSHNWSTNAENNSDENTLIIHDPTIANIYLQEFEKRWGELASTPPDSWDCIANSCVDPGTGAGAYTTLSACQSVCGSTNINETVSNIEVYPNPVKDILIVKGDYISIDIFNVFGKLIFSSEYTKSIDVSLFSKGIYMLEIKTEEAVLVKKIMIQ